MMRAFVKSVLIGALATAALPMIFTTFLAIGIYRSDGLPDAIWLAVAPLAVTGIVTLTASVLVGLPLTALLKRTGRESGRAYILGGGAAGLLLPLLLLLLTDGMDGWWLGLFGALGGVVTARTWWVEAREPACLAGCDTA